jgi:hypothetical protein
MKNLFVLLSFFILFGRVNAQYIVNGTDTLLGNEWIQFDQSYFKIKVAQDAMYRLTGQVLIEAGIPIGQITGVQYQLWHNGQEVPIYTSTDGAFGNDDFIDFYGQRNTSELDRFLFENPDSMMMNPLYSMFTDTAAYFLTWVQSTNNLRFANTPNNLTNLPNPDSYYLEDFVLNYSNRAFKQATSDNISFSDFTMSEGFSTDYALTSNHLLTPTAIFNGNIGGSLQLRFSGRYNQHTHEVSLNDQVVHTADYFGHQIQKPSVDLSNSQLSGNMNVKITSTGATNDFHRVSNIILTYPRLFDFGQKTSHAFKIGPSSNVRYLEIANFNSSGGQSVLYDLTNRLRIEGTVEGGLVKLALPPSMLERQLVLVNETAGVVNIPSLDNVNFINYGELDHDFIIVTSERLLDDGNGNNYVQEYANYRASSAGGNFNPIVVNIEELYDQFSWGIEWHPFAVRNFGHFAKKNWSNTKYYFIIGKGREYPSYRSSANLASALASGFFVPTYSFPGSDNLLLAGTDRFTPIIPIGRLAALKPKDVSTYLKKVKEFESNSTLPQDIAARAWMKNVLHMGGGLTQGEQSSIRNGLQQMEEIIEGPSFGAEVKSFYKSSTDPIQVSQTDQIFNYINNGTSIISFFGHSAVGTFDFSIDNPDNFNNKGKYPLLISLGCYSGNIHTSGQGIGERFCLFEDKAAIAFAATSGQGYIVSLNNFASKLYQALGGSHYGKGVGDAMQSVIFGSSSFDFGLNLIRQQFNLHGDPSLSFGAAPGPDYLVDGSSFRLSPDRLNTQMANFEARFELVNLGKAVADSLVIKVSRELPDGSVILVSEELVAAPSNRSEYMVSVPLLGKLAHGFNKLFVTVDDGNRIAELPGPQAEQNNELYSGGTLGHTFYISDNGVECVYPTDFAIVGNPAVELIASTAEPLTPERMYVFQMDTTANFNSPLLIEHKIMQAGGVLKWKPTISFQNEMVYYWRISPDSISPIDGYVWDNSSFVFLNASTGGWNQSHFYQWKENEFNDMELKTHENLKFIDNFKDVFLRNAVNSLQQSFNRFELQINNAFRGRMYPTVPSGIYVIVLDSLNTKEWVNLQPSQYGYLNPNNHNVPMYLFSTQDLAGRTQLIEFLRDVIPSKNFVLLATIQADQTSDYRPEDWPNDTTALGTDLFQILEGQGANLIRNTFTTGSLPYVFGYQKDVGPLEEVLADSLSQVLRVNISLPGYWDRGSLSSVPIGPVKEWQKLVWDVKQTSPPSISDTISLDVLAYNPATLTDSVIFDSIMPGEHDLSGLNAETFPYLKLRFNSKDTLERTSLQLNHWRILYKGLPDFALNPSKEFVFDGASLQQGEPFRFKCFVENLSDFESTDSLWVKYSLRSSSNNENTVLKVERPLAAHDSLITELNLSEASLSGSYSFMVELNPEDRQLETTRANNVLVSTIDFKEDKRNPLLDITFDGIRILDGDLVSAKPKIRIGLKDENPFLPLNDTSIFKLFMVFPDSGEVLRRIYFNDPNLVFHPATGTDNNRASIELTPTFTLDGDHKLIIQARDITGNQSGRFDHKVGFKIITKSSVSNFLNYPNPFTTSTRFVYTMTGAEPPARYKIQIMTTSGRIVREITQDELGPLRVGTHQTDFAWDGTDEFGDRLAKGVYLYRMLVQDAAGKDWDGYDTSADKYFSKGFGKMVLLR